MKEQIKRWLKTDILIGMDEPENIDKIVSFCVEDIRECSDNDRYSTEDLRIAFRRYLEQT